MTDQHLEKIFREPIWEEFDENTHRIRRNLLWVSTIALIIVLNGLSIKEIAFEGMKIQGLNTLVYPYRVKC